MEAVKKAFENRMMNGVKKRNIRKINAVKLNPYNSKPVLLSCGVIFR